MKGRTCFAIAAVMLFSVPAVWAQAPYDYYNGSQVFNGREWATVKRAGTTLFGIPVGAGGYTKEQRANIIANQRLDVLLDQGVLNVPDNIRVGTANNQVVIYVNNPGNVGNLGTRALILTIDTNFSKILGRDRWAIARYWRDLMRKKSRGQVLRTATRPDGRHRVVTEKDPAGRPLDNEHSWHMIPSNYGSGESAPTGGGTTGGGTAGGGGTTGGWGVPGED